jgi:hypothetical protein
MVPPRVEVRSDSGRQAQAKANAISVQPTIATACSNVSIVSRQFGQCAFNHSRAAR